MAALLRLSDVRIPPPPQTVLQRIADADSSAIQECLELYGDFVWRTVKNRTGAGEEAEKLVEAIFQDIWQYAGCFDSRKFSESDFIRLLIRHRLRRKH